MHWRKKSPLVGRQGPAACCPGRSDRAHRLPCYKPQQALDLCRKLEVPQPVCLNHVLSFLSLRSLPSLATSSDIKLGLVEGIYPAI